MKNILHTASHAAYLDSRTGCGTLVGTPDEGDWESMRTALGSAGFVPMDGSGGDPWCVQGTTPDGRAVVGLISEWPPVPEPDWADVDDSYRRLGALAGIVG